jgi:serine/threonine protein kinase
MDATGPGRLLAGRYRLTAVIGNGGMGVVWRGHDELLGRDVAVKEILWPPHLTEREQQVARLRATREAQVAARLSHQNVVRVYDVVEDDGHPCIVMELLPYQSLRDLVKQEGRLPPVQVAQIGLGVLGALSAAHAEGILHRDVKPANILVGPDGRVVLTDFGIARAADSPTLTGDGALIGSPSYIAPERAHAGPPGTGAAGDLWGLGASLYTAVEGRPPFERDSALATLTAVVAEEPEQAPHAGPLEPVISGLLRKDPEQRLDVAQAERLLRQVAESPVAELRVAAPWVAAPWVTEPLVTEPLVTEPPAGEPPAGEPPAAEPPVLVPSGAPGRDGPASRRPVPARPRRSRGLAAVLAVLIAAAAAATGLAFTLTRAPGNPGTAAPGHPAASSPSHAAASQAAAASVSPTGPATPASTPVAGTSPARPSAASSSSAGGAGGNGALPAGYHRFTNSTGFSIGVPDGWLVTHQGHYVYITDPSDSSIYLLIDQSDHPKPDPLADWEQQQANRQVSYPDYHLISLRSVNYPQAEKAADWEFTYVKDGVPVHILNRNILANDSHAYALYWSTPESDWSADYHYFQAFAATFQPASAQRARA